MRFRGRRVVVNAGIVRMSGSKAAQSTPISAICNVRASIVRASVARHY
jgi:hypothetical protein